MTTGPCDSSHLVMCSFPPGAGDRGSEPVEVSRGTVAVVPAEVILGSRGVGHVLAQGDVKKAQTKKRSSDGSRV